MHKKKLQNIVFVRHFKMPLDNAENALNWMLEIQDIQHWLFGDPTPTPVQKERWKLIDHFFVLNQFKLAIPLKVNNIMANMGGWHNGDDQTL